VHERHRSPYPSPSRSPWQSSKCARNNRLRMARRSIWTRAKHRVGLERPHFWTRFRAQIDAWGRSSHEEIPSDVLPASVGFQTKQVKEKVNTVEDGKNYPLHFENCHFFTRRSAHGIHPQGSATTTSAKVTAQKRSNRAGATPLFCGRSAQKCSGSLAPAGTSCRRFARLHASAQELVRQNV
jgi:hypothetical protein